MRHTHAGSQAQDPKRTGARRLIHTKTKPERSQDGGWDGSEKKRHGSIFPYSQLSPVPTAALTGAARMGLRHWRGVEVLGRKVQPAGTWPEPRGCGREGDGTRRVALTRQGHSLTTEPTDHPEAVTGGLGCPCLSLRG